MPPKQGGKSATSLFEINSGRGRKGAGDRQPDRRKEKGREGKRWEGKGWDGMGWWEWSLGDECL